MGLFDIIERLTVRYGVVAMVGDVVLAGVVVAIVVLLEASIGLPKRVGSHSPSVANAFKRASLVRAFGDISHDGLGRRG